MKEIQTTELYQRLALLTDAEAERCLNGILHSLAARNPKYKQLLASPNEMARVVESAASQLGRTLANIGEISPQERPKAIRVILNRGHRRGRSNCAHG